MHDDNLLVRITHQARHSYLLTPITDLIADARTGRAKYAILTDLDVSYLVFHAMNFIIRNMGSNIAGVEESRVKEDLQKVVAMMAPDKLDKDCAKAAALVIETLLNADNSYYPYRYKYFDSISQGWKALDVKLVEFQSDNLKAYYKLGEQGFLVFRSMLEKSLDVQAEMEAYIIQLYIDKKDYVKASQLIGEGTETLIETQHRLLEMRRRVDHMVRIDSDEIRSETEAIHVRIDRALRKNQQTYQQIPTIAHDGSDNDRQLQDLDKRFSRFIGMFAKTVNMIEDNLHHFESRLMSRISNINKSNLVDFSIYNHVMRPLLLKTEDEMQPLLDDILCALFPARLKRIDSPYQLVKENISRLSEVEDEPENWQEDRVSDELDVIDDTDKYFINANHNIGFRNLILEKLAIGPVKLSDILNEYRDEYEFYQLKSFYLYLLSEYFLSEKERDDKFSIEKVDKVVSISGLYKGNDLLITKKSEVVTHG